MAVWESLLLTAVGGGIGAAGTWLGSHTQAKQTDRVQREQHEREDRFRLHKERIEVYSAFYIAAGNVRQVLGGGGSDLASKHEARSELWRAFTTVLLVGHRDVLDAASAILAYTDRAIAHEHEFELEQYGRLIHGLQYAARADLTGTRDLVPPPQHRPAQPPSATRSDGL